MKITKFEQSGFIIEADNGYKLAIDIGNKTPVEKLADLTIDAMLISHIHGDHFHLENIKALAPKELYMNAECIDAIGEESLSSKINKVKVWDNIDIEDFHVSFFNVDHGPNLSAPLPENFGFLIEIDGQKIFFCGDMYYPSGIPVEDLEIDWLLLPVGGHYTFGPQEALAYAKQFKKVGTIIPMHYEKNNFIDSIRKEEFIELAKDSFTIWN